MQALTFPNAGIGGFAVGGAEGDDVFAGTEGDVAPGEDAVGVGLGDAAGLAVDEEFGGADVGEGADEDFVGLALGEALFAEVEDGDVVAPVGLIEVVGVLEGFAVVGDEAFVVDAVAVAFGAVAGGEVEEVPDEGAPEVGTFVELGPVEDVVFGLPGLGVELAGGVGLADLLFVVVDGGAGAVFADGDAELGVLLVGLVEEVAEVLGHAAVPAVVAVPGDEIGDEGEAGVVAEVAGADGGAGGVFGLGEGVEFLEEGDGVGGHAEFVEEAPDDDGGVVLVLADHLDELLAGVLVEAVGGDVALVIVAAGADEGDLGPDEEARAVAGVVHLLGLRIVRQADGVGAHVAHDFDVAQVVGLGEGGELAFPLLVAADAAELQVLAVEEEALVGVDADVAHAEGLGDAVFTHADGEGVEEGVSHAVPAVGVGDGDGDAGGVGALGGEGLSGDLDGHGLRLAGGVGEGDVHGQLGLGVGEALLADTYAGGTVVQRAHAHGVGHDELHAAIETAEDVEVAGQRDDVGGLGVGDADAELGGLARGREVWRELIAESGVGAAVLAEPDVVELHVGDDPGPLEAEEDALALPLRPRLEVHLVDTQRARVRVGALGVGGIPGVRQGDGLPVVLLEGVAVAELPSLVQGDDVSGLDGGAEAEGKQGEESFHRARAL